MTLIKLGPNPRTPESNCQEKGRYHTQKVKSVIANKKEREREEKGNPRKCLEVYIIEKKIHTPYLYKIT